CPVGATGIQGEFEQNFADLHERRFALATNGGTAALMLSLHGAGVQPGDEVVGSPFTWGASVSCALQCGAIPIFADVDRETFTLDPRSVAERITPRSRAIVVVHLFGGPADLDGLLEIATAHGLALIEDCAQATGALYRGRRVGSMGDFGAFSLQASKTLTGGEGGILVCDDRTMYERAMSMGTHPQRLVAELELPEFRRKIDSLAFNFRMHTVSAAIANRQLPHLDSWTEARNRNARLLYEKVADLPFVEIPRLPDAAEGSRHAFYHVPFILRTGSLSIDRDLFCRALQAEGVPAEPYVRVPMHLRRRIQEYDYLGRGFPWSLTDDPPRYARGDCPVAESLCEVEWQVKASFHTDVPELIDQIAGAIARVGEHAGAIAEAARAGRIPQSVGRAKKEEGARSAPSRNASASDEG
ncbi:MAG: DegT/DnrJ/EryC1/StrS family aminotransferase, partial [Myxococcota bacterium]